MKTRYKILLVIGSFVTFYFALIPILQVCNSTNSDCIVWREMVLLTRPVVSSPHIWDNGSDVGSWTGTPDGMEVPALADQIMNNLPFVTSMIVLPFVIIGFVVVWDKRRN
ncbi:MAG: hypothetical protein K5785_08810 [Nitrosarchaeum sp.]|nr:hypothetical protein [Nitrosarchaeum sp.]